MLRLAPSLCRCWTRTLCPASIPAGRRVPEFPLQLSLEFETFPLIPLSFRLIEIVNAALRGCEERFQWL